MVQRDIVRKTIVLVKPYFVTICGTYLMLMQESNVNRGEGAATVWSYSGIINLPRSVIIHLSWIQMRTRIVSCVAG